jgi:hypothetical protein
VLQHGGLRADICSKFWRSGVSVSVSATTSGGTDGTVHQESADQHLRLRARLPFIGVPDGKR